MRHMAYVTYWSCPPLSADRVSHLIRRRSNVPIRTSHNPKIEILGRERRRRWTASEKLAIVQEMYEPDVTASCLLGASLPAKVH